jgi:protease I
MIHSKGLGFLSLFLVADKNGKNAYFKLIKSNEFNSPIAYSQIDSSDFDGLILPGGHAQGIKEYLEPNILQEKVSEFFSDNKPVGAICHGTVLTSQFKPK